MNEFVRKRGRWVLGEVGAGLPPLALVCILCVSLSCQRRVDLENDTATLLEADRACAELSIQAGFPEAYHRYLADDAIVMPPGAHPLYGREATYATFREEAGDDVLEWEPQDGTVSRSGDLGWTWGNWVFTTTNENGEKQTSYGKYVFIWRRVEGKWKIAANIWNDSPKPG